MITVGSAARAWSSAWLIARDIEISAMPHVRQEVGRVRRRCGEGGGERRLHRRGSGRLDLVGGDRQPGGVELAAERGDRLGGAGGGELVGVHLVGAGAERVAVEPRGNRL